MSDTIDTGDIVKHGPTGETWTVAYVRRDYLARCGWPPGEAPLRDCTLIKKATPEERVQLLRECAAIKEADSRRSHAIEILEREGIPLESPAEPA